MNAETNSFLLMGRRACLLLCLLAGQAATADTLSLAIDPSGTVNARDAAGTVLWSIRNPMSHGFQSANTDEYGHIRLDDRYRVDRLGRMLAMNGETTVSPPAITAGSSFAFDAPVEISLGALYHYSPGQPLVDSNGNIRVIIVGNNTGDTLQLARYDRASATWLPTETLYTTSNDIFIPAAVIDANDRITVAFRELINGENHIRILRHVPGVGWSGPTTVYQTPDFFQQVDAAVDARGNVVVSFDPDYTSSMASLIYDVTSDSWSGVVPVTPPTAGDAAFATLIQNRVRTHIYALYWDTNGPAPGLYARRFLTPALGWSPLRRVPGTAVAGIPGATGPASFIPATVDDAGNVTVPSYIRIPLSPFDSVWIVRATRFENGAWQAPRQITVHLDREPLSANFADADYNTDGDVFIVFPRFSESDALDHYTALHYIAGTGDWETPAILNTQLPGETRSSIVCRADGSALATFNDNSFLVRALAGRLFQNGIWGTDPITVPGNPAGIPDTVADGLDVIMVYNHAYNTFGTWYHESAP